VRRPGVDDPGVRVPAERTVHARLLVARAGHRAAPLGCTVRARERAVQHGSQPAGTTSCWPTTRFPEPMSLRRRMTSTPSRTSRPSPAVAEAMAHTVSPAPTLTCATGPEYVPASETTPLSQAPAATATTTEARRRTSERTIRPRAVSRIAGRSGCRTAGAGAATDAGSGTKPGPTSRRWRAGRAARGPRTGWDGTGIASALIVSLLRTPVLRTSVRHRTTLPRHCRHAVEQMFDL